MAGKVYNFKAITVVPTAKDFVDIVLSKTQRQTPTVVHRHYQISRIRNFYTRKIKFTHQTYYDKLTAIINEFPRLDDVHPFYADLMNVLYDKDHYKLAMAQVTTARHLIDNITKDYVRLVKYADSLYRCKQLKRAALGRMCTLMRRQNSTLEYLEEVRQHLSRLPSIDPNMRTLIVTGFPNVGKSSFVNKITRADVEVQPYAFTTKSLFVGHTDYHYLRWQVIDTPGLLDHPLEERNTIEMQAVTALAHLRAAILFLMDLSEQCGFTVPQQLSLFENIRPLFVNKPLVIVVNKVDVVGLDAVPESARAAFERYTADGIDILPMSTLTGLGVMDVRNRACDLLLAMRVEARMASAAAIGLASRVHVAMPAPRDDKERAPFIPEAALARRVRPTPSRVERKERAAHPELAAADPRPHTLRDTELEMGDDYALDMRAEWDLENPEWRYDPMPEILDGKNVADFIDPDILQRLEELEAEEEMREAAGDYLEEDEDEETKHIRKQAAEIRDRKMQLRIIARAKRSRNHPQLPPSVREEVEARTAAKAEAAEMAKHLREMGIEAGDDDEDDEDEDDEDGAAAGDDAAPMEGVRGRPLVRKRKAKDDPEGEPVARSRSRSRSRSQSVGRDVLGLPSPAHVAKARRLKHAGQRDMSREGRIGEADRTYRDRMPKHLFSGKRKSGTTDRR